MGDPGEQLNRSGLVQWLVEVSALRRLDAGGTTRAAGTFVDQAVGVVDEALERGVALAGYPDAARMAVVDEDRRAACLVVVGGREPADVPAVAHRDQWEDRDLGVLGSVERSLQRVERELLA